MNWTQASHEHNVQPCDGEEAVRPEILQQVSASGGDGGPPAGIPGGGFRRGSDSAKSLHRRPHGAGSLLAECGRG